MSTFNMIARLSHDAIAMLASLDALSRDVVQRIRDRCDGGSWKASCVALGAAERLDMFNAPTIPMATKVATIVRSFGRATVEVWPATEWKEWTAMSKSFPPARIET